MGAFPDSGRVFFQDILFLVLTDIACLYDPRSAAILPVHCDKSHEAVLIRTFEVRCLIREKSLYCKQRTGEAVISIEIVYLNTMLTA